MKPLELDQNLCNVAKERATILASRGSLQVQCDSIYGQNLYCKSGTIIGKIDIEEIIKSWYDEVKAYKFDSPELSSGTGHFTQIVWAASRRLGISKVENQEGQIFIVALYDPPGNCEGQYKENVFKYGDKKNYAVVNKQLFSEENAVREGQNCNNDILKDYTKFEVECLKIHNELRALHQSEPLTLNRKLCSYANEWASVSNLLM